ncbi:hypothetical protein V9T40_009197 [Parthenolecanium corni]|uniref:Peptidyl-prolyl cis-trans isomerase n=1 Tax=Parthenolecanium corni TaxID=536013 RepID=A0AAN9TRU7_9HEMI
MAIVLETTIGDMTIDLFTDIRAATCKNFLKLCKMKYYNFNLFYSIQNNFIAQTGDPSGTGKGGDSVYSFVKGPEMRYIQGEKQPRLKHSKPGLVSMVNCGEHLIGSQFFITLGTDLDSLDEHIIFGEVTEGHEVLLKLNDSICDFENRPYQDIRITHTVVLDDPFDEIDGLYLPPSSPEPSDDILNSSRIAADEVIDDTSGLTQAELNEIKAQQEAKAQATILEIVGDIPDAEIAPPENVLFVCKLNPVTTDEDLEIIFGRFGKIIGCEVIRDKISGDSLQYAFIEFAEKKSCEEAYFKMDNVLIDDRRIHVDFSQSVSKMRWRGKGRGIDYYNEDGKSNKKSSRYPERNNRNDENAETNRRNHYKASRRSTSSEKSSQNFSKHRSPGRLQHRSEQQNHSSRERFSSNKSRRKSKSRSRSKTRRSRSHSPHRRNDSELRHRSKNHQRRSSKDRLRQRSRSRNRDHKKQKHFDKSYRRRSRS